MVFDHEPTKHWRREYGENKWGRFVFRSWLLRFQDQKKLVGVFPEKHPLAMWLKYGEQIGDGIEIRGGYIVLCEKPKDGKGPAIYLLGQWAERFHLRMYLGKWTKVTVADALRLIQDPP